jgi:hypothetical protein
MTLKTNEFFNSLVQRLYCVVVLRVILILVTAAALPIAEGILTNMWSAAPDESKSAIWTVLMVVAVIHLLLAGVLLVGEVIGPEVKLARAAQIQEESDAVHRELRRREKAYRMVRECLSTLTKTTCTLPTIAEDSNPEMQGGGNTWCQSGFEAGLQPIFNAIMANMATTLGVVSSQFTIEVHLQPHYILGVDRHRNPNGFNLRFFSSTVFSRLQAEGLTNNSPAVFGRLWNVPNQRHISEDKASFYDRDCPKREIYFRRFATCPITPSCSDDFMGVLVLTSMQEEPFVEDVLDTLQFISSIVSNYVSAYCDCYQDRQRFLAVNKVLPDVPSPKRQQLASAFDIPIGPPSPPPPPDKPIQSS